MNKIQKTAYIDGTKVYSNKLHWFHNSEFNKKETEPTQATQDIEKVAENGKKHRCLFYLGGEDFADASNKADSAFNAKFSRLKGIFNKTSAK